MDRIWMRWLAVAVLAGGLVCGCGRKGEGDGGAGRSAAPAVKLTPAEEAKAAVETAIANLKAGRLDAVYDALPASYRADVAGVVKAYAAKIDRDLYTRSASLLASAGELLSAQADNLAALWAANPDFADDLPGGIGADALTGERIRHFAKWLSDLPRTLSYDELASGNIKPLLSNPLLGDVFAEGIALLPDDFLSCDFAAAGEGAALPDGIVALALSSRIDGAEESDSEEVQFVKIEGKWIPVDLVQGWNDAMRAAKEAAADFEIDENARRLSESLFPVIERSLDSLKAARTSEELQAQALGAFMTIGLMAGNAFGF